MKHNDNPRITATRKKIQEALLKILLGGEKPAGTEASQPLPLRQVTIRQLCQEAALILSLARKVCW